MDHPRATSLLLRILEGRDAFLTLEDLQYLEENEDKVDKKTDAERGGGGVAAAAAAEGPYCPSLVPDRSWS